MDSYRDQISLSNHNEGYYSLMTTQEDLDSNQASGSWHSGTELPNLDCFQAQEYEENSKLEPFVLTCLQHQEYGNTKNISPDHTTETAKALETFSLQHALHCKSEDVDEKVESRVSTSRHESSHGMRYSSESSSLASTASSESTISFEQQSRLQTTPSSSSALPFEPTSIYDGVSVSSISSMPREETMQLCTTPTGSDEEISYQDGFIFPQQSPQPAPTVATSTPSSHPNVFPLDQFNNRPFEVSSIPRLENDDFFGREEVNYRQTRTIVQRNRSISAPEPMRSVAIAQSPPSPAMPDQLSQSVPYQATTRTYRQRSSSFCDLLPSTSLSSSPSRSRASIQRSTTLRHSRGRSTSKRRACEQAERQLIEDRKRRIVLEQEYRNTKSLRDALAQNVRQLAALGGLNHVMARRALGLSTLSQTSFPTM